jgi:tetratricopeptide (TPR) repeat protein
LGYIGSTSVTEGPLADPKDRLHTLRDLQAGFRHHQQHNYPEAVIAFRRALAENPGMLDAWEFLARSLHQLGDLEESLEAYAKALEISSGASHLAVSAASLYFDLGRLEEAESHARLALDTHPSFAYGLLARIALRRDEPEAALELAQKALDEENTRLGPRITLAEVLHAQGRFDAALQEIAAAEAAYTARQTQDPELIKGLYLLQGKIFADLTETERAEQAFLREIELFPKEIPAYTHLALLYGLSGRSQEVSGVLQKMVAANPEDLAYVEAVKTLRLLGFEPGARSLLAYALRLHPESEALAELR